jgi:uncharacterized DUF497 family protein
MAQLFEFDTTKSEANKSKHGLNFIEAQGLWNDEQLLIIPAKYLKTKTAGPPSVGWTRNTGPRFLHDALT